MSTVRGSWSMNSSVLSTWQNGNLDDTFRNYWRDSDYTEFLVLHEDDPAPANAPGPYCVYEIIPAALQGHSSGKTRTTFQQYLRYTIRFHIHAQSQAAGDSTAVTTATPATTIAKALAQAVVAVFDPSTNWPDISPDTWILIQRTVDHRMKEGEDETEWLIEYQILVDATYDQ